jgi:hypothetical protein
LELSSAGWRAAGATTSRESARERDRMRGRLGIGTEGVVLTH